MNAMNAFFSGSVKNLFTTLPTFFPSNVNYDDIHTNIDPSTFNIKDINGTLVSFMKGYI